MLSSIMRVRRWGAPRGSRPPPSACGSPRSLRRLSARSASSTRAGNASMAATRRSMTAIQPCCTPRSSPCRRARTRLCGASSRSTRIRRRAHSPSASADDHGRAQERPMQAVTILARAIHFASILSLAGVFVFLAIVAEPALARSAPSDAPAFRGALRQLAWASLAAAVLSGALWLMLEACSMSDRSLADVFSQDVIGVVLTRTRFGRVWELRSALGLVLAGLLVAGGPPRRPPGAAMLGGATPPVLPAGPGGFAWAGPPRGAQRGAGEST